MSSDEHHQPDEPCVYDTFPCFMCHGYGEVCEQDSWGNSPIAVKCALCNGSGTIHVCVTCDHIYVAHLQEIINYVK